MKIAALVAWIVAAAAGFHLLAVWLANGGLRRQATKVTRYPSALVVGHPLIAAVGLVAWVLYLTTAGAVYAWCAFTALIIVVLLGFVMLTRWLVAQRGGRHARGREQVFPLVAVVVHGTVAFATFVLVFLTAIAMHRP
jgi:cytochrome bd-type quinol oxidase subunit 2